MWWHDRTEAPHQRSSGLRKEHYKRFWTMLLHRSAWNDIYLLMKTDDLAIDHRTQRFDWHKRDIMPKCVVTLLLLVDFPSKTVEQNKTQQTMCIPLSLLCKLFPHVSHIGKPTRIGKPMANKCYDTFWHYVPLVPVKALCSVVYCQIICLH
jgi:hypothetical protein